MNPMNGRPWSQPPVPPMFNHQGYGGYPGYPQQNGWMNPLSTASNWVSQLGQMGATVVSTILSLLTAWLNVQKEGAKDVEELSKHST
jgi:hypothetical protein